MNPVVRLLQAHLRQTEVADRMGYSHSVIFLLWNRFRETGSSAIQHQGQDRLTLESNLKLHHQDWLWVCKENLTVPKPIS